MATHFAMIIPHVVALGKMPSVFARHTIGSLSVARSFRFWQIPSHGYNIMDVIENRTEEGKPSCFTDAGIAIADPSTWLEQAGLAAAGR
jgi:hypothetical protein